MTYIDRIAVCVARCLPLAGRRILRDRDKWDPSDAPLSRFQR